LYLFLSQHINEVSFDIFIQGIKDTVVKERDELLKKEVIEKKVREESKITLYRLDFLLRQRLDQFIAIFGDNSSYKNGKLDLISDTQGRLFWTKYIGEKMLFTPWKKLITSLATHLELTIPEQTEEILAHI